MNAPKPLVAPSTEADGAFESFRDWVNHATSWIGGGNALCADSLDRVCLCGADFMRARDEGTFPVRYWFGHGRQSPTQQRREAHQARRLLGRPTSYEFWNGGKA